MEHWRKSLRFWASSSGMSFAFHLWRMLFFASGAALSACAIATSGCIATDKIDFQPQENYPPSIVSEVSADFPLNEIGQINLDDPVELREMPLQVIVRDPNLDQSLDYRIFLDAPDPPAVERPIQEGVIDPTGFLERPQTFTISYNELPAGQCHKIELVVVGMFASNVEQRRPVEPGDFDEVTWWVEVVDADNPVIVQECR
jgi:hypothetical protein